MAKMNKWVIMDYIIVRDWVYIVCQMLGDKEGVPRPPREKRQT